MIITWRGRCALCECPLDVVFEPEGGDEERWLREYEEFYPHQLVGTNDAVSLENNASRYKRVGGAWVRACKSCLEKGTRLRVNPRITGNLEIGLSRFRRAKSDAMTLGELEHWATSMARFFKNRRALENL